MTYRSNTNAIGSAQKLLERLGHRIAPPGQTKMGFATFECKSCQDKFILEDNRSMASLYRHDMWKISSWQSRSVFESSIYDRFAKEASAYPELFCARLRIMI